jgi:hypothetical protein
MFMIKKLSVIVTVIILAMLVVAPVGAGISGPGVSGIQVQNLSSTDPATVNIDLWNQLGGAPIPLTATAGDSILKSTSKTYYLPSIPAVTNGQYAMVVSANQPVAAIARTDWSATGGAALYNSVAPGTDVTIPLVVKSFANQTTQFTVQNTDTTAQVNDVQIVLRGRGLAAPVKTLTGQVIAQGTSKTYNLSDTAVWGTLPNTGTDLGASGFVGSVRITSAKGLVVQSFIDLSGSRAVTGFTGVPTASASSTLYCPLIRANYYGDTGINIVNPNASAITATITFYGAAGSPHTGNFTQTIAVPANSMAVAFQGPGGNSRSAPTSLPGGTQSTSNPTPTNNGFFGVAKITTTGGTALAVVNDTFFQAGWAVKAQGSYNCATAADAGTKFALPLLRRYHLSSTKLTTGINIQNISATPITVTLTLSNWDGTAVPTGSNPAAIVIPANGSGVLWNGSLTGLPTVPANLGGSGWFGSGVLTITGGQAVVEVSDEGFGSTAVDLANYMGLKIQ